MLYGIGKKVKYYGRKDMDYSFSSVRMKCKRKRRKLSDWRQYEESTGYY
jgi:hypothetical protein